MIPIIILFIFLSPFWSSLYKHLSSISQSMMSCRIILTYKMHFSEVQFILSFLSLASPNILLLKMSKSLLMWSLEQKLTTVESVTWNNKSLIWPNGVNIPHFLTKKSRIQKSRFIRPMSAQTWYHTTTLNLRQQN